MDITGLSIASLAGLTVETSKYCYIKSITITYTPSETPTCDTPTFSPAAGTFYAAQNVEISCLTEGATIYYTTDGSNPNTSSSTYSSAISVSSTTTIKALAAKSGYDNSEIATATYTIKSPIAGYAIDFEEAAVAYTDWNFNNIETASGSAITAHGGSQWGHTTGQATASITTKNKVALPGLFTCYISKESSNSTDSNWKIQTSSDGSTWTDVATKSATGMSKGVWQEFSADISAYSDVYVRLSYGSNTAVRAVDDITLSLRPSDPVESGETVTLSTTSNMNGWRTFYPSKADQCYTANADVYYASASTPTTITLTKIDAGVPANTPVILHQTSGTSITLTETATNIALPGSNLLAVSTANQDLGKVFRLGYKASNGVGFYTYTSSSAPAGIVYVNIPSSARDFLGFDFGDEATGVNEVKAQKVDGDYYNLAGQRVAQPTKGLYIVNGKKVIVK